MLLIDGCVVVPLLVLPDVDAHGLGVVSSCRTTGGYREILGTHRSCSGLRIFQFPCNILHLKRVEYDLQSGQLF